MDKLERQLIQCYLTKRKGFLTAQTPKERLRGLLERARPFETEHELLRMGPKFDGGYLIPDDLEGVSACFSPGVGSESRFEKECLERGLKVFLADASVNGPAEELPEADFIKKYLGANESDDTVTLTDWVSGKAEPEEKDLLLQMDIEGAEYEVFLSVSEALLSRFRIILVEFHNVDEWLNLPFFRVVESVFDKLLKTHLCVHNHPNTSGSCVKVAGVNLPKRVEMSFLRRDRVRSPTPANLFPHALDASNKEGVDYPLPECWYLFSKNNEEKKTQFTIRRKRLE